MADPCGFLNINKPAGLTSHDVVARLRRSLRLKKVGHAGTLDPLATGVLVICVGAATRLSEYVMASRKRYQAVARLGVTTDTYDADGQVVQVRDASGVTRPDVEAALNAFRGDILQHPPAYSAIKQGGRKLYELARAGEVVEAAARPVTIHALDLVDWSAPQFTLDVACSAGTYIRSLAYDLGEALGVGAHLTALTRTASGIFDGSASVDLGALLQDAQWQRHLISPQRALADYPAITLTAHAITELHYGRPVPDLTADEGAAAFAYAPDGTLVAVVHGVGGLWRPHKVFLSTE
ncbi:MAG: tRNA pseudouridine(55) synthase TruB [Anaerolineae bacterium]|nr:tRNA pseudouridine(55) synthase TruB [Anaerolineae bacterium]